MSMTDRGVHPDLIDEEAASREQQPAAEAPRTRGARGRRGGEASAASAAPSPEPEAPPPDQQPDTEQPPAPAELAPEWFAQVREAFDKDPAEAFKLLAKNLPRDQLERDETISGLVGHKADVLLKRREQEAIERAKREAAANNDLYTLGELTQRELQEREAQQQAGQVASPIWDGVVLFQQSLPESLQKQVAGRTFGEGKGLAQGYAEYLQFLYEEGVKLGTERELQRRESALRKSVLSEVNGDEPVPERESGTPGRVREVTDEQIAAMSMREYEALFDENGHPKPGVRHRPTRSIPLRPH